MPIGDYAVVPHLVHALRELRPADILDLGAGSGFLGAVVRQWLDYGVKPWNTRLTGVEAFGEYTNPLWDLYNSMYVTTIQDFLYSNRSLFDCVVLGDVIEHFEKDEGLVVLESCTRILAPGGRLFIATPGVFLEQGDVHGNGFERHLSLWTSEEFEQLGFHVVRDGSPDQFFSEMLFAEWRREAG